MHWCVSYLCNDSLKGQKSAFYLYLQKFRLVLKSVSVEASDVRDPLGGALNRRVKGVLKPAGFRGASVGDHATWTIVLPLDLRPHHLKK